MDKNTVGVIIGRFQVDELHEGHRYLVNYVMGLHEKVIILLGCTSVKLSMFNPMDFETRKLMFEEVFGNSSRITILPLHDVPRRNDLWSNKIDKIVGGNFPGKTAVLYGSRLSCLKSYEGKFPTIEIDEYGNGLSGTEVRKKIALAPIASRDFRRGCIYQAFHKNPIVFTTVDIAILNEDDSKIVLGRKHNDPIGQIRFVGGFADVTDSHLIATARREATEETGVEIEPYEHVGSLLITEDPRYKYEPDQKIMTHLYKAKYVFGRVEGADDLEFAKWYDISELKSDMFVGEHKLLFQMLVDNIEKIKNKKKQDDLYRSTVFAQRSEDC